MCQSASITGTNGKTTSVTFREAHSRARQATYVGMSSTDFIAVNERIVDRDDWSGPGGARAVLREQEVDSAILETARGGLLRRGLGVERADDAALITNISEDHLGDFGSRNLEELLDMQVGRQPCRACSRQARSERGRSSTRREVHVTTMARLVWFSLDARNKVVTDHVRELPAERHSCWTAMTSCGSTRTRVLASVATMTSRSRLAVRLATTSPMGWLQRH